MEKAFQGEKFGRWDGLPIAFLLLFLLFYSILPFFYGGRDLWRHYGVIASFTQNPTAPEHETLAAASNEREMHSPVHFVIALSSRVLHIEPLLALRLSGLVNLILFIAALFLFCRCLLRNASEAVQASAITIFLMLFGHWTSIGWSGETTFENLPYIVPQPSLLALALLLLAFPLFEKLLDQPQVPRLAGFAFLLSFVLLSHPPTGLCLLLQMTLQTLLRSPRRFLPTAVIFAVGLLLAFCWPYIDLLRWLRLGGTREHFENPVFLGAFEQLGPAILIGLPALVWMSANKKAKPLLACTIAALAAFSLGLGFHLQSLARFLFYSSIYLNILTAVFLIDVLRRHASDKFALVAASLVILFSLGITAASPENRRELPATVRILAHGLKSRTSYDLVVSNRLAMLQHHLHPGDVVLLANLESGEPDRVAAFTGAKFVFSRFAQTNSRYEERRSDEALFFSTTDPALQRQIIEKYGVTALLILRADIKDRPELEKLVRTLGRPTDENRYYVLYRLAPDGG